MIPADLGYRVLGAGAVLAWLALVALACVVPRVREALFTRRE